MSNPVNWKRSKENDNIGIPRTTYRVPGTKIKIMQDGVPSRPFTIYWDGDEVNGNSMFTGSLGEAKAEVEAHLTRHPEEIGEPDKPDNTPWKRGRDESNNTEYVSRINGKDYTITSDGGAPLIFRVYDGSGWEENYSTLAEAKYAASEHAKKGTS